MEIKKKEGFSPNFPERKEGGSGTKNFHFNSQKRTPWGGALGRSRKEGVADFSQGNQLGKGFFEKSNKTEEREAFSGTTSTEKIADRIAKAAAFLTAALLPLFFLANVPSPLELGKQVFLTLLVGIGCLAWIGKMALRSEIKLKRNFFLIPLVAFLVVLGLSSVFSIYPDQSFWGYFGGEGKSFITILFLGLFSLLVINNFSSIKEVRNLVISFWGGGLLTGVIGLLQILGVFVFPFSVTKTSTFNTVGNIYLFGIFAGVMFVLSLVLSMAEEISSKILRIAIMVSSFFFFFLLMVVNFKILWFVVLLTTALVLGISIVRSFDKKESQGRILPMVFLVFSLIMIWKKEPFLRLNNQIQVFPSFKTSITMLKNSLTENIFLGVGPAHFDYIYKQNRDVNSLGNFWSVVFDDAASYFLTTASTTGLLGILSFLFLIGAGSYYFFKSVTVSKTGSQGNSSVAKDGFLLSGVGAAWFFVTLTIFVYSATTTILMAWWFLTAVLVALLTLSGRIKSKEFTTTSNSPASSLVLSFSFVILIISLVSALYLQTQKYVAAAKFNQALVVDSRGESVEKVRENIEKAIAFDSGRDIYFRNLAVALFAEANKRIQDKGEENLSDDDINFIRAKISGSIQAVENAKNLNSSNSTNYVAAAQIYENLITVMPEAKDLIVQNYTKAAELDPHNPAIHYALARAYVSIANLEIQNQSKDKEEGALSELPQTAKDYLNKAKDEIQKSLEIMPDYLASNILLASVYELEGNLKKAIEKELETKVKLPGNQLVAFRLGLFYYKDGQKDKAKKEFEEAIRLDENYSNARYFLGLIQSEQGERDKALENFKKISEFNPDNEEVKKIIENLSNNRPALEGIAENSSLQNAPNVPVSPENQPGINPEVEQQEIPQEAAPELNQ